MSKFGKLALLAGAAFTIPAVINLALEQRRGERGPSLPGDGGEYAWPMGKISYTARGEGDPLLFVHGIGAGESSYEWRHNVDALAERHRVYALDLPGFGMSAKPDIPYSADLYVLALLDFIRDVIGGPTAVVASSLSGAFVVKLAWQRPELISRLILVCPTGLEQLQHRIPVLSQMAFGALSLPTIGQSIYNGIASYDYIESYARKNLYWNPALATPAVAERYYRATHQPGGRYAIRSFLSGLLTCDISPYYAELNQEILIVWGRRATMSPVENTIAFIEQNPNATACIFENSRSLPHDEEAVLFNSIAGEFLCRNQLTALEEPSVAIEGHVSRT